MDPELSELARRAIKVAFDDRQEQLHQDVEIIQNDMAAGGWGGRSGAMVERVIQRGAEEIRARGRLAVAEFRRVLEEAQAPHRRAGRLAQGRGQRPASDRHRHD